MLIEYDAVKDRLNFAKHGLSLAFAGDLDWDSAVVVIDHRYQYDELRMRGLVPQGNKLYYVVFVDRGDKRRVISLRRATAKILVSIRYSPEVIAFFKNSGDGWQTRMDEVLREYVRLKSSAS